MAICRKNVYLHEGSMCFCGDILKNSRLIFKAGEKYKALELPHMSEGVINFVIISSDGEEFEFFSNNCADETSFSSRAFDFSEELKKA